MEILPEFKDALFQLVIAEWEKRTNHKAKKLHRDAYLTVRKNGPPQTTREYHGQQICIIRDSMILDPKVQKYVLNTAIFKKGGKDTTATINAFNGYPFYNAIAPHIDGSPNLGSCSLEYLNCYSIYIGYSSFAEFIDKVKVKGIVISKDTREKQKKELLNTKNPRTKKTKPAKSEITQENIVIPDHFCGVYEGFFLSPEKDYISRLTALVMYNDKHQDYHTFCRTFDLEMNEGNLNIVYYEGRCRRPNEDTLNIHFYPPPSLNKRYEFLAAFDISDKKSTFKRYLKGIYAGSDPTNNNRPVAGRMILYQLKNWRVFGNGNEDTEEIKNRFLTDEQFSPKILNNDEVFDLFKRKEPSKKYHFKEFFTEDTRYIENTDLIKKYRFDPEELEHIIGEYSIFSISSNKKFINRGVLDINSVGEVQIKGSRLKQGANNVRFFKGFADVLPNDILAIEAHKEGKKKESLYYLLKINTSKNNDSKRCFEGVRIMTHTDGQHLPFSSNVVLLEEKEGFYNETPYLAQIPIEDFKNEYNEIFRSLEAKN